MAQKSEIMNGNEAIAHGAIAVGMNFFTGYPITPATEIAELLSELLPKNGGKFMQMEDELASISTIIGASFTGCKAMTATSGPGFSLMQENLGWGCMAEIPIVIVDVMRQGPSGGVATAPAQGDIMQARWGTHGDHPVIALAPCSVSEAYYETIRAFNLAEEYRTPVIMLSDAMLAHMSEKVQIASRNEIKIINRKKPAAPKNRNYKPYEDDGSGIPPMASFGDGYRWYVSGIHHDATGFPATGNPQVIEEQVKRICGKIERNKDSIERWEEYLTDDADIVVVAVGLVARCAKAAADKMRANGIKVGVFRPVTVWPFPERRLAHLANSVNTILTCEMNEGQIFHVVKEVVGGVAQVRSYTQNNGKMIEADSIVSAIQEVL